LSQVLVNNREQKKLQHFKCYEGEEEEEEEKEE
jgi:hypothetical protein